MFTICSLGRSVYHWGYSSTDALARYHLLILISLRTVLLILMLSVYISKSQILYNWNICKTCHPRNVLVILISFWTLKTFYFFHLFLFHLVFSKESCSSSCSGPSAPNVSLVSTVVFLLSSKCTLWMCLQILLWSRQLHRYKCSHKP